MSWPRVWTLEKEIIKFYVVKITMNMNKASMLKY